MASGLCVCYNESVFQEEDENMEKKNEMKPLDDELLDMVGGGIMTVSDNIKCPYCGAAFLLRDKRSADYDDHVKECRKTHGK